MKLLVGNGSTVEVDKIPIQAEFEQALEGYMNHEEASQGRWAK